MANSVDEDDDIRGMSFDGPPITNQQNNKFKSINKDGSIRESEILDHNIQELYSQALYDRTAYLCVYFPAKVVDTKKVKDKEVREVSWSNTAYFVINDGIKKKCLEATDNWLAEHFKINVMLEGTPRWDVHDYNIWLGDSRISPEIAFDLIKKTLLEYIEFDNDSTYNLVLLWVVGTYFYRLFDSYPYLDLTGTKRAGKSKVLEFLKLVCFNAIMSPDFTGSTVFRLTEKTGATLLLDEAENFKREKNEQAQQVRTLIMQGFLKDQYAYRTNTDKQFSVEPFNLYSPKAMAHINTFDDVLEDRCIQIVMKRATDKTKLNKWPTSSNTVFQEIRNYLYRLFLDYSIEIETYRLRAEETINVLGREKQLWTPMLTFAYFFEAIGQKTDLVKSILNYALISHQDRQIQDEQENQDLRIAKFLWDVGVKIAKDETSLKGNPEGWVPISVLYHHLVDEETAKLYDVNPTYFNQKKLSHTLKRLGIKTERKRGGYSWFVTEDEVKLVKQRLGLDEGTLDSHSQGSPRSQGSHLGVDATNECEGSEGSEHGEGKGRLDDFTNECEGSEGSEVLENNESSQGSPRSQDGDWLIRPKDNDED